MRIAQLATNVERVPPAGYGGTELVVSLLSEGFVSRGHDVTLFGTGDSQTTAKLISVIDKPLRSDGGQSQSRWPAYDINLLMRLEDMQDQFDIIHNHLGWQALPFLSRFSCPVVTTNHNLIKDYCAEIYLRFKAMNYVAISETYKRLNYPDKLNYVSVIYNGIKCDDFDPSSAKRDYLLFIGRLGKDKGTADAMEIAKKLNLPLKLAGKVDANDRDYFTKEVEPRLSWPGMEFIGEVNAEQKRELYANAIAVVYPIAFDEPFGLVMAESLASGTPVMAFRRGAVPEILRDGETAVIGNTVDELVAKFPTIRGISRQACVDSVRASFDSEQMISNYEKLFTKLIG